ncbi:hypothetical protein FH609_005785 [Streptomyces sp. 3MP-14]|uniref:Uncharacterized protein n=1 Tax=Streptomyces mimosae TaxID=2586635 RepID=A0A5N6AP21_9ACTN|nr:MULTISPECIES: hypothetical protein [Streptomyces]KAB8169975.1 hypothetical protein FH607_003465 [Streptomyces mimosae]KAB8178723.1 hypothetical protein FH609_005785 [Streptomyces sp. 3MP-14]
MTDARLILVLPDREAAEEVAERVAALLDLPEEPEPVRDALAGEDDAEDAQWLVVLEEPVPDPGRLAALAEEHEGWLERDEV